jgi:formylglycine-generating enzyme required for sulfatase activity
MKDKSESEFDYYFAQPTNTLSPDQANFGKRLNRTCKVGSYQSNPLGLFDMHGNVWEWCNDEIFKGQKNPKAVSVRVHRGGSWLQGASSARAASRYSYIPSKFNNRVGARLARVPAGKEIVKVIAPGSK